jgi:hypothetical protein
MKNWLRRLAVILAGLGLIAGIGLTAAPAQASTYYTPQFHASAASVRSIKFLYGNGATVTVLPGGYVTTSNIVAVYNHLGFGGRCTDKYGNTIRQWGSGEGWVFLPRTSTIYSGAHTWCREWF